MERSGASWRTWAFGFLGGALLSALRAPLGLDLLRVVALDAPTSAAFRGAALLAIAMAVYDARIFAAGVPMLALLTATLAGYLAHGLYLEGWLLLGTRGGFALLLVGSALALNGLARSRRTFEPSAVDADGRTGVVEALGFCLAGGGAACAAEILARPLRSLGLGLAEDDTVFGGVFLLALLFGAAAFGGLVPVRRRREALAAGLGLGALACALGADRLASLADPRVLVTQVRSLASLVVFQDDVSSPLRADVAHVGTWRVDAVLAASCLLVPGLVLGAALGRRGEPKRLAWVLVGAALGSFVLPFALRASVETFDADGLAESTRMIGIIGAATRVAAIGGALVLLRSPRGIGRLAGFAGTVLAFAGPSFVTVRDPWLFTPWVETPRVVPRLVIDAPEGLLSVEHVRGGRVTTLDRVRLTPVPGEQAGDEERILRSLALLGDERPRARVLLVGQLTPERSAVFESFDSIRLECTAPWWRNARALEESMFEGYEAQPVGSWVPMPIAAERIRDGEYDLVIVPPVFGQRLPSLAAQFVSAPARAPRNSGWEVPEGSLAVVWLDSAADLEGTNLGERVLVSASPIEEPCIGVVIGTPVEADALAHGAPASPGRSSTLRTLAHLRLHAARSRLFERLAESNAGGAHEGLMRFLSLHFSAQAESTPFASRDERVEIDPESLPHLRAYALAGDLDPFARNLIEDVATILGTKRRPDLTLEFVEPIARAHAPWPALDRCLLVAFMEFDLDEEVMPRLRELLEREPYDLSLILMGAQWEEHVGRPEAARALLERALDIQPDRPDVLKRMALLLRRQGSDEAQEWTRKALEAAPEDPDLLDLETESGSL